MFVNIFNTRNESLVKKSPMSGTKYNFQQAKSAILQQIYSEHAQKIYLPH